MNLLDNAIKYAGEGAHVTVQARALERPGDDRRRRRRPRHPAPRTWAASSSASTASTPAARAIWAAPASASPS